MLFSSLEEGVVRRILWFSILLCAVCLIGLSGSSTGKADEPLETGSPTLVDGGFGLEAMLMNAPPTPGDCDYGLPEIGSSGREDVLIIVNDNSVDSCEVGVHYAKERALGWKNICHVKTRPGYFISWDEFEIMRDQIIKYMQENTLDYSGTPVVCSGTSPYYCQESMEQLREHTKIRYIVTTLGVPTRTTVDNSSLWFSKKNFPTSVDNYLRYWLINYFEEDVDFDGISDRHIAFEDGRGMREVNPAVDNELIIGRIDGIDLNSAKASVDRAIDAENNGIFGKLYSTQQDYHFLIPDYSPMQWYDYGSPSTNVYGGSQTAWRYQHGIFGKLVNGGTVTGIRYTSCEECLTHIEKGENAAGGTSPQECVVKLTSPIGTDELHPGAVASRQPIPDSALIYFGYLDGHPTSGNFDDLLNWHRSSIDNCEMPDCGCEALCENTVDPDACRATSTDPFKEINTECVGVADGFIGYNFQSYPVSYLTAWPTGWRPFSNETTYMAFPEIRTDEGYDDNYSMWFRNLDQAGTPTCYTDSGEIGGTPTATCFDERLIEIVPIIDGLDEVYDSGTPQKYRVSFWYRGENVKTADTSIKVHFRVHEKGDGWVDYPYQETASISTGDSAWTFSGSIVFTINPDQHSEGWNWKYDRISFRLESNKTIDGEIGFDVFSIEDIYNGGTQLAPNNSFDGGHKQTSSGDWAVNFLSRLNGTAFWGSLSHHQSGGYSFSNHCMETLIYFFRGLPLGDAVWFADSYNSGVLYGDPLYSPVAVHLHYSQNEYDFIGPGPSVELFGDTVNGNDPAKVDTKYSVEYGPGEDFFVIDNAGTPALGWQSTGLTGTGGTKNMSLGLWDISAITPGTYTLRLSVTGTNNITSLSQTFYDYHPVVLYNNISDFDEDGIADSVEVSVECLDPTNPDVDDDGLLDGEEDADGDGIVDPTETDPCDEDTDNDGMPDGWEVQYQACMNPLVNDANGDPDEDGVTNIQEYNYGINPCNDDTDSDYIIDGIEVGSCTDPADDDTDGDCIIDGNEDTNRDGDVDFGETDPCDTDFDPWVDDDWAGCSSGTTVWDPDGNDHIMGCDAFARIQDAIDPFMGLFTVNVAPGTYYENIEMKKGLIIQGADVNEGECPYDYVIDGGSNGPVVSAVEITEGMAPEIEGFIITSGLSGNGGGMYINNASPTVTNCIFSQNSADQDGGGIYSIDAFPTVVNCTFIGNTADRDGGGICNVNSSPSMTNCIFSGNSALNGMAVACNESGSPSVVAISNCILWDGVDEIYNNDNSIIMVNYSDFDPTGSGTYTGTGNISTDPEWVNPGSGDFHLKANSPCLDAGTNSAVAGITGDFEGDARIIDGDYDGTATVDMGVDEAASTRQVEIYVILQGEKRPVSGWEVPINVGFYPANSGTTVLLNPGSAIFYFSGTTTYVAPAGETGTRAFYLAAPVDPGSYDITADSATTLLNVKREVDIP
ncbi:MAG: hypothetical protein R6U37_09710 [Dehalococcoidia bacterium]